MVDVRRRGIFWHALLATAVGLLTSCSLLVETGDLATGETRPADSGAGGIDGAREGSVEPAAPLECPGAGRSCVAEAPIGWVGPVILYDGPPKETPSCPASMAVVRTDAHRELSQPPPHACEECSCSKAAGQTCTAILDDYAAADCSDQPVSTTLSTACKASPRTSINIRLMSAGGSCPPSGGKPILPAVPWGVSTRACGAPDLLRTGCDSGKVCAPDAPGPFRTRHCVTRAGDLPCPGAPYEDKLVAHEGVEDARACSACTCGPPSNGCSGVASGYGEDNCFLFPTTMVLPVTSCLRSNDVSSVRLGGTLSTSATCEPTGGGVPSGDVKPSAQVTICCAR